MSVTVVSRNSVSAAFIEAIGTSHTLAALVRVYRSGVPILDLAPMDGAVSLDATAAVRSTCEFEVADDGTLGYIPTDDAAALAPYGNQVQLARGVQYANGDQELVSLGFFRIDESDVSDTGDSLVVKVSGQDRAAIVSDAKFEDPYTVAIGTLFTTAILALVQYAIPDVTYRFASSSITTPALIAEEGEDRWDFAQGLAAALGAELFFDSDGVLVLRPVPTAIDDPSIYLQEGDGGVLLDATRNWARAESFNKVIVTGENTSLSETAALPRGEAYDNNPNSPTYYYGSFGKVPRFESSEFITTNTQAQDMASGILAKELGTTQAIDFGAVVDPRLSVSDVVQITRERIQIDENHVVDTLDIPLAVDGNTTGRTRSVQSN